MKFILSLLCLCSLGVSLTLGNGFEVQQSKFHQYGHPEPKNDSTVYRCKYFADSRKLVCYYTNWSSYRSGSSKYTPADIDPTLCTHVVYSFAVLDPNSLEMVVQDRETDILQGFYAQVTSLKRYGVYKRGDTKN